MGKQPAAPANGKALVSSEAVLKEGCSAAHLWPSHTAAMAPPDSVKRGNRAEEPGQFAQHETAAVQPIEVEEVEWRPDQPLGSPSDQGVQWAASAPAQESLAPEVPAADVRCGCDRLVKMR